jgi:NAD(P)H-hydrate repair Nnr-like enzyme with NAD(P)H-hydrate epimerase domain
MGKGAVSNLLMEYAGMDIAEALKFMVEGDRKHSDPLRVRRLRGEGRRGDDALVAFDTTDTLVVGEGTSTCATKPSTCTCVRARRIAACSRSARR